MSHLPALSRSLRRWFLFCWLLSSLPVLAQSSGWEALEAGDFFAARDAFAAQLAADSTDREALLGQLFLYDIWEHEVDMRWLARRLLAHHPEPVVQEAFRGIQGYYYRSQQPISPPQTPRAQLYQALWRMEHRELRPTRYTDWVAELSPLLPPPDWELIGPFRNVGGSGHLHPYGPETDATALGAATFDNGLGKHVSWVRPAYMHPLLVRFEDHLPDYLISDIFYARQVFSVDRDTTVEIRLGRSEPVRLWLDGQLLLDEPLPRALVPDDERIRVQLGPGRHVLLVKTSPLPERVRKVETFNLRETDGPLARGADPQLMVRLTAPDGTRFQPAAASSTPGSLQGFARLPDTDLSLLQARLGAEESFAWSDYYLLARLYHQKGLYEAGEQYFLAATQAHPEAVFLRILLTTFYARTGNRVLAFQTLRQLDLDQTPVFGLLYQRLEEVNAELEPTRYKEGLDALAVIAPSNRRVISGYIAYYNRKRDAEGMAAYEAQVLATYPAYEDLFDSMDRTRNRDQEETKPKRNRTGRTSDRKTLKALAKSLERAPYQADYYLQQARIHFRQKEYPAAHAAIDAGLAVAPVHRDLLELHGDLFREEGRRDSALAYYQAAKRFSLGYSYRGEGLDTKIKEFVPPNPARDLLTEISLDSVMAQAAAWMPRYRGEDALILYWTKSCLVDTAYNLECKARLAIRINTPQGIDNWAEENYRYLGNDVSLQVQKADGSIYQPELSGTYGVIRNLAPGDIILGEGTRSYNLLAADPEFGADLIQEHWFSFINPVLHGHYELVVPQDMDLYSTRHNLDQDPEVTEAGAYRRYRWALDDLPRLQPEEASPDRWDMAAMLQVTNQPGWSAFANWYHDLTYRKLEPHYLLQGILDTLLQPGMSPEAQVEAIYSYITREIRYSSVSFLQSNFIPLAPDITCTAGIGDCKDVATLMIAMLRMVNIEAWYVLVLADAYLPYEPQPHMLFNHAIVAYELEGETRFMDLTTDRYPRYVLPEMDANAWALIIRPGESELVRLPDDRLDPAKNLVRYTLTGRLDDSLDLQLQVAARYPGVEGGKFREFLNSSERDNVARYLQQELPIPALPYRELDSLALDQVPDINQPLAMTARFRAQDVAEALYGLLLVELPLVGERNLPDALATTEPRRSHLDLAQLTNLAPMEQELTLYFPPGYTLYRQPEDVAFSGPYGHYRLHFQAIEGGLVVKKSQAFAQAVLPAADFEAFKAFYRRMIRHDRTRLVLVREGERLSGR